MSSQRIQLGHRNHHRAAVRFLPVVGLALACARSHEAPGESSHDSGLNHMISGKETTAEADSGDKHTVDGDGAREETDLVAARIGEDDLEENGQEAAPTDLDGNRQEAAPTMDDQGSFAPKGGIEIPESEEPSIGVWLGETREEMRCLLSRRVLVGMTPGHEPGTGFGFVVFGEREPPLPLTDPDTGHPPEDNGNRTDITCRIGSPTEGFAYTILDGRISEDGRFRFRVAILEFYEAWCAVQTSYHGMSGYRCWPDLSSDEWGACVALGGGEVYPPPAADAVCPLDYGKFELCGESGPCICREDGCTVNMDRTLVFDLVISDTSMEGIVTNLSLGDEPPTEVRLRKVQ